MSISVCKKCSLQIMCCHLFFLSCVTKSKPGSLFNIHLPSHFRAEQLSTLVLVWGVWRLGLPLLMGSSAIRSPSYLIARCLLVDL